MKRAGRVVEVDLLGGVLGDDGMGLRVVGGLRQIQRGEGEKRNGNRAS